MRHFASPPFWDAYGKLPERVREVADKNYALLKKNSRHPSLQLKKVGRFWSVRVAVATGLWRLKWTKTCYGFGSVRTLTTTP